MKCPQCKSEDTVKLSTDHGYSVWECCQCKCRFVPKCTYYPNGNILGFGVKIP